MRFGGLPQAQGLLYGAKPVMVAIIVQAVWKLGRTAFRRWQLALAGLACFAAALAGAPPIAVLLAAGGACTSGGLAAFPARARRWDLPVCPWRCAARQSAPPDSARSFSSFSSWEWWSSARAMCWWPFSKTIWWTACTGSPAPQLLDAITAGQITPGPVFATATFLGYLLRGWAGAAVATVAIFLPSFLMAGLVGALAGRIRKSALAAAFLDGVNAAAVALMAAVALSLGRATLVDGWTWALGLASAALLLRYRINATWLILGGAAAWHSAARPELNRRTTPQSNPSALTQVPHIWRSFTAPDVKTTNPNRSFYPLLRLGSQKVHVHQQRYADALRNQAEEIRSSSLLDRSPETEEPARTITQCRATLISPAIFMLSRPLTPRSRSAPATDR